MLSGGILIALLVTALLFDLYSQQIPNWLIGIGVILSFVLTGFYDQHLTLLALLSGLVVGTLLFLPLFLLGKMGAGDIKLLGMAGCYIGPLAVFWGALFSLIAGGFLAVIWTVIHGWSFKSPTNDQSTLASQQNCDSSRQSDTPAARIPLASHPRRMPFAPAIAVGCTLAYLGFPH